MDTSQCTSVPHRELDLALSATHRASPLEDLDILYYVAPTHQTDWPEILYYLHIILTGSVQGACRCPIRFSIYINFCDRLEMENPTQGVGLHLQSTTHRYCYCRPKWAFLKCTVFHRCGKNARLAIGPGWISTTRMNVRSARTFWYPVSWYPPDTGRGAQWNRSQAAASKVDSTNGNMGNAASKFLAMSSYGTQKNRISGSFGNFMLLF